MSPRHVAIALGLVAAAGLLLVAPALGLPRDAARRAAEIAMWASLGLGLAAISGALAWQTRRGFAIALGVCANFATGALAFYLARGWLGGP